MFISITHKAYIDIFKCIYLYELTDSELGICEIIDDIPITEIVSHAVLLVKKYQRHNLLIAENIALFNIYYHKKYKTSFITIKEHQDKHCPKYINNWSELSPQIDKLIEKYLLLQ